MKGNHLLSACCVPGAALGSLRAFILHTLHKPQRAYACSRFVEEDPEAVKGNLTHPTSHGHRVTEPCLELRGRLVR